MYTETSSPHEHSTAVENNYGVWTIVTRRRRSNNAGVGNKLQGNINRIPAPIVATKSVCSEVSKDLNRTIIDVGGGNPIVDTGYLPGSLAQKVEIKILGKKPLNEEQGIVGNLVLNRLVRNDQGVLLQPQVLDLGL